MPGDHFLRITNGCEIDLAVPLVELPEQGAELSCGIDRERLIELANSLLD
jgi:hypothetical protein